MPCLETVATISAKCQNGRITTTPDWRDAKESSHKEAKAHGAQRRTDRESGLAAAGPERGCAQSAGPVPGRRPAVCRSLLGGLRAALRSAGRNRYDDRSGLGLWQ